MGALSSQPKPPKPKRCGICTQAFVPQRMGQRVCGPACAIQHGRDTSEQGRAKLEKAARIADKARLLSLKPLAYWAQRAQQQVNRYVRLQERGRACISCGKPWQDNFQAGHYLSRGARPELRFHLDNLHVQCIPCNLHKSGNATMYRVSLVRRIGPERVAALEGPHTLPKWRREDYQRIEAEFKALADALMATN